MPPSWNSQTTSTTRQPLLPPPSWRDQSAGSGGNLWCSGYQVTQPLISSGGRIDLHSLQNKRTVLDMIETTPDAIVVLVATERALAWNTELARGGNEGGVRRRCDFSVRTGFPLSKNEGSDRPQAPPPVVFPYRVTAN